MSVISKSKLKKEFLDGNTITQSTMRDLIDSCYGAGEDGTVTSIGTGAGLTGGPITTSGTISLTGTGAAGVYTSADITVDAQGRITAAASGGGGGGGIYGGSGIIPAGVVATMTAANGINFRNPTTMDDVLIFDDYAGRYGFALGEEASNFDDTSVTVGSRSVTNASGAIAIGDQAEANPSAGANAIAIGVAASADDGANIAIGEGASAQTDGSIAIGGAIAGTAGGQNAVAIGMSSKANQTAGGQAVAIGYGAIADADDAIAIGTGAATVEEGNISIGTMAGAVQVAGDTGNVFIGNNAGSSVAGGADNVFIGNNAGSNTVDGTANVIIGSGAGESLVGNNYGNTLIGMEAGAALVGASIDNATHIGRLSGDSITTGVNTLVGASTGQNWITASGNVCMGLTPGNWMYGTGATTNNVLIGDNAGPSADTSMTNSAQAGVVAIGGAAGQFAIENAVADFTVNNSIYIGTFATVPADGQNQPSRFVLGGGFDSEDQPKLLMYGGYEDVDSTVSGGGAFDARLKINPGTGIGFDPFTMMPSAGTATYPDATLQVINDGSGTTQAFRIDDDVAAALSVFEIDNTGVVTIGNIGGTPYSLPNTDGNANEVLTTDGAGSVSFRPVLQHLNGAAPNVGDQNFGMPQVHFSDVLATQTTNAGMWIVPFDVTITQIQIKWAGDTAPTIGPLFGFQDLTWDIGTLANPALTPDTTKGTINYTSSTGGAGLPALTVLGGLPTGLPPGDSETFFYKTWTGSIDFTLGDIMIMYYSQAGPGDWSENAKDVQIVVTYFQRH